MEKGKLCYRAEKAQGKVISRYKRRLDNRERAKESRAPYVRDDVRENVAKTDGYLERQKSVYAQEETKSQADSESAISSEDNTIVIRSPSPEPRMRNAQRVMSNTLWYSSLPLLDTICTPMCSALKIIDSATR